MIAQEMAIHQPKKILYVPEDIFLELLFTLNNLFSLGNKILYGSFPMRLEKGVEDTNQGFQV
jgi:hypothetical protein